MKALSKYLFIIGERKGTCQCHECKRYLQCYLVMRIRARFTGGRTELLCIQCIEVFLPNQLKLICKEIEPWKL